MATTQGTAVALLRRTQSGSIATSGEAIASYTLETIYNEAMEEIKALYASGKLPEEYYTTIIDTNHPDDVLIIAEQVNDRRIQKQSQAKHGLYAAVSSTVKKLTRYAGAIDMLAQSSPQAFGLNIAGLIWGFIKVLMIVAQDIVGSFETINKTLREVERSLPLFEELTRIYGTSEIQLLRQPLVEIYASIVSLGLVVIRSCKRGSLRTFDRSVWNALQGDLDASMARLEIAGKRVERAAQVEHMHATKVVGMEQDWEIYRQEKFRGEVRSRWRQPNEHDRRDRLVPINDAPLGFLTAYFTGRESELAQIASILCPRRDRLPARCAIVGMPGLGKTQLALKYTSKVFDQSKGPIIFWASAATTEKLTHGLCRILDLVDHSDRDHPELRVRLRAAQHWLEHTGQDSLPWLLVLDNANEETVPFMQENLPRSNNNGAILFTMRSNDVAEALISPVLAGTNQGILHLEVPNSADARRLLLAKLQAPNEEEALNIGKAEKITKSVGYLPLAINHLASFAKQHLKGLDYVLDLFQDQRQMDILSWDNYLSNYEQRSVMTTFSCKLDQLAQSSPVTNLLLQMLSFYDPESISLNMIKSGAYPIRDLRAYSEKRRPRPSEPAMLMESSIPPDPLPKSKQRIFWKIRTKLSRRSISPLKSVLQNRAAEGSTENWQNEKVNDAWALKLSKLIEDRLEFPKAIRLLREHAFIFLQSDETDEHVRIHDLVRAMVRYSASKNSFDSLCYRMAVATFDHRFQKIEPPLPSSESWPAYDESLPHYRSLVFFQNEQEGCNIDLIRASRAVSSYLTSRGRSEEAALVIEELLPLQKEALGVLDVDYLASLDELATIYDSDLGRPEPESLFKQSLRARRKTLGATHPDTLATTNGLARSYTSMQRHEEALALAETAFSSTKKACGADLRTTPHMQHCLARIYRALCRYNEAESLYEETLEWLERNSGIRRTYLFCILVELGDMKRKLNKLDEADNLMIRAQAWQHYHQELGLGDDCWEVFIKQVLGPLHQDQGRYLEAEVCLRDVFTTCEHRYGQENSFTVKAMINLAWFYVDMFRLADAESLFKRLSEICEQLSDTKILMEFGTSVGLAYVVEQQNRSAEAELLYRRVLDTRNQLLGVEFSAKESLSRLTLAQGRTREAGQLHERALALLGKGLESLYAHGIYDTQMSWRRISTIGRILEDEEMSQIPLKVQEEKLGLGHPVTQKTLQALLSILHTKGNTGEIEGLLQRSREAGLDINPPADKDPDQRALHDVWGGLSINDSPVPAEEAADGESVYSPSASINGGSTKNQGKQRLL